MTAAELRTRIDTLLDELPLSTSRGARRVAYDDLRDWCERLIADVGGSIERTDADAACRTCGRTHPTFGADGRPPSDYREVRRDGRLLGWAPLGDDYPICAILMGPRVHTETAE